MPRLIVTGPRHWPTPDLVWARLDLVVEALPAHSTLTVVHGACPTGVDRHAADWCEEFAGHWDNLGIAIHEDPHPADWSLGPKGGPVRNGVMVAKGADSCLAFMLPCAKPRCRRTEPHWSHGADDCATRAEAAGVPTVRIGADGREVAR